MRTTTYTLTAAHARHFTRPLTGNTILQLTVLRLLFRLFALDDEDEDDDDDNDDDDAAPTAATAAAADALRFAILVGA